MRVPIDVTCKVCLKVFCCTECRYKHEIKLHAITVRKMPDANVANEERHNQEMVENKSNIYIFCPICEHQPLALQQEMYEELLAHIQDQHLPLRCKKCAKLYTHLHDLKEFSKCLHPSSAVSCVQNQSCSVCDTDASKTTVTKKLSKVTISTQTSPFHKHNELHGTPISVIDMHWKTKSKLIHEGFTSDSVSSIKNISSISNGSLRRSIDAAAKPKGALVRTTSTPVHAELLCAKTTEGTFNASGGQVSSIYNSGVESDNSPALPPVAGSSPSKQYLDNVNLYLKVGGRAKMSAVTPLRQVMSKSIQKAFAEHGAMPSSTKNALSVLANRKHLFDSNLIDSSNSINSPLDLRLSPAKRRTLSENSHISKSELEHMEKKQSEPHQLRREILLSSQKMTTESIVITRTQHVASRSLDSVTNNNSDGQSFVSCTGSDQSSTSTVSSASASSVYKTCHSVEIITATTARSELNIRQHLEATEESQHRVSAFPLSTTQHISGNSLGAFTPITSIPGAIINKKLIRFDTPNEEAKTETEVEVEAEIEAPKETDCSTSETAYYTPNATPVSKNPSSCEPGAKRHNLKVRCSPARRPAIRECTGSSVFSRINNSRGSHYDSDNDEVFQSTQDTPKEERKQRMAGVVGRSWSFGHLLGTVMRLSSFGNGEQKSGDKEESYSSAFIKRCASIAGSLVSTTTTADEDQLSNLKRKRSYTIDTKSTHLPQHSYTDSVSPNADYSSSISSKRIRIQGRKPIERMRRNT